MPFVRVAALSAIPPGSVTEAVVGDNSYAICNVDGEVHALVGICPHAGGPLGQGALHGDTLVCPWHAWEYNCRTGVCLLESDLKLEKIPVKIDGGEIFIDTPAGP